ncbi:hypothetical protein BC827DRAFT_1251343 [Russula dissimulans]|nr:hypothetical protein BC827DRAFT_1251343 [Russula dissimulans]
MYFGRCRSVIRSALAVFRFTVEVSQLQVVMSMQQHWHEGSRVDYITSLALARSHAESHGRLFPSHSHPFHHRDNTHPSKHMPTRFQPSAIPDLRFEPTYLAKLQAADPGWKCIVWITIRDHAISPLLQGALWGTASVFLQPLLQSLMWWRYLRDNSQPQKEGRVAGWLRQWARSIFSHARLGGSSGTR